MKKLIPIIAVCLVTVGGMAHAAPKATGPTPPPVEDPVVSPELINLKLKVLGLQEMQDEGVITAAQEAEGIKRLLAQAEKVAGHDVTLAELLAMTGNPSAPVQETKELTWLQRAAGFVTFMNIMWVLGIILGAVCFIFLFGEWVTTIFKDIPLGVYEVGFYGLGGGLVFWATRLSAGYAPYVGLAGCLLFGGAAAFTATTHFKGKNPAGLMAFVAGVWAVAALLLSSSLIGFFSVAALMSALGFSIIVMPGAYAIGFNDDEALARGTISAFMILTVFAGLRMAAVDTPHLSVFETGGIFLGAFVGYLGLLIISSKWYAEKNYVFMQILMILLCVAALYVGSTWQISVLQKIGGTFLVLWFLEKVLEIAIESRVYWAYWGLLIGGLITGGVVLVKSNMAFFAPYLPF